MCATALSTALSVDHYALVDFLDHDDFVDIVLDDRDDHRGFDHGPACVHFIGDLPGGATTDVSGQ